MDGVGEWAGSHLADLFVDDAYASAKGYVRTYVLHHQLIDHLPAPPASVLDVGGGAGHQSFPLARAGYEVTLLDSSPAMLDKAREHLERLPEETRDRITLLQADGLNAEQAVEHRRFAAVLCHGVLGYVVEPDPWIEQLCRCAAPGAIVSIMTSNAETMAVRPALERRWADALSAFDADHEVGVLGVRSRADTVRSLGEMMSPHGVQLEQWYGAWLFVDWLEFSGADLTQTDVSELAAMAAVELQASRRDPYRRLSRAFHLIGRKSAT